MPIIPMAQWMPDASPLHGGSAVAINVIPRSASSYGPFYGPNLVAAAPPDALLQAIGVQSVTGASWVFAGSQTALWRLEVATGVWANVTGTAAIQASTGIRFWQFAQFKNQVVAATGGSVPAIFDMTANTAFATLPAGAPIASFAATVKSFLMLGRTNDPVGGVAPWRVWWSAINDPMTWPAPGTAAAQIAESDYNDSAGPLGQITGVVSNLANADGAILYQHGVQRVIYTGPPDIFQFPPAVGVKGCVAPGSVIVDNSKVYYLAEDGFYSFDGAVATPIGAGRVDRWFLANWVGNPPGQVGALPYPRAVFAYSSPINRSVAWLFVSTANLFPGGVVIPDMILVYCWAFDRWSTAKVSARFAFDFIHQVGLPPRAGFFDAQSNLVEMGGVGGAALAAVASTIELQPVPGGRCFVRSARPLVDGGNPSVQIAYRNTLQVAQSYGPDVAANPRGEAPQRVESRYVSARVSQPAGAVWTHIEGVDPTIGPAGTR